MINLWWYDRDTRETQKDCFAVSVGGFKHETIYPYYREITRVTWTANKDNIIWLARQRLKESLVLLSQLVMHHRNMCFH